MSEMEKYLAALGVPNLDFNSKIVVEKDMGTHGDDKAEEEEDVKLIKKMVKKDALKEEEEEKKISSGPLKQNEKKFHMKKEEGWHK